MITREALRVLENNLTFTKTVNRQYDDRFGVEGAKIGTVLNVRKPPRYVGRTGTAISIEDATETQVAVTLDTQFGVDISFTSEDLALKIDDFSKRFISPAVATIANKIDHSGLGLYTSVYNSVGTPGTTPNALLTYLQAGVKLDNNAAPMDGDRAICITPLMQATIVDALKGLFQQSSAIASQYRRGQMGTAIGFDWYMDQNCNTHTVGPLGGTPLVNGGSQTGASLVTDGWTAAAASRLKKGDVFTIAGVNSVNPQSRQSTGELQQFVVTADVSSDGSGNLTAAISPSITTSGAFQTVTGSPADNAAITVVGAASTSTSQGLLHHKDAFTLAMADLPLPQGTDMAARVSDSQLGMSIRMIRDYDITTDKFPCRLDVLFGWAALRPELACRIQGK
tara:strand:+ start:185 stop:1369 length:1185 start_codon:yes stop_codon:yes gene_type:complete